MKEDANRKRPEDFEHLLMQLAIDFVKIPSLRADEGINRALAITGEFTGVDRSYLMLYHFDRHSIENTHEWCAEGIEPMIEHLRDVPMDGLVEDWISVHQRGDIVHVPLVSGLPMGSALRDLLEPQAIVTLVAVPLKYEDQCLGFVGFDAVRKPKEWTGRDLTLLRMLAELFTNAEISRRKAWNIEKSRQRAESAERLMKKALEATGTAIWETSWDSTRVRMVSGWHRLTGTDWDGKWIQKDEFLGCLNQEDAQVFDEALSTSLMLRGNSYSAEFRFRHPAKGWLPLRTWWIVEEEHTSGEIRLSGGTVDNSETVRARADALRRIEMERCLSKISSRFVDSNSFASSVDAGLRDIGRFSGACRADFFLLDHRRGVMNNIYEWCDDQVAPQKSASQNIPLDLDPAVFPKLAAGEVIAIPDVMELSGDLPVKAHLLSQGIRSLASAPLLIGGKLEGFIGVESTLPRRAWSTSDLELLRTCAAVFAGALARSRAELTIHHSERLHRAILNSLNEIVLLTDDDDRITFINQAWMAVTGRPVHSAIGLRLVDLLDPRDAIGEHRRRGMVVTGMENQRYVVRMKAFNGETLHLSVFRRRLGSEHGTAAGTLISLIDVTAEHRWEENLIAAKIKAEDASEAKTLYLSNLSHELRTPMHGVLGMLELMMESGSLDTKMDRYAKDAHASASSLLRLLDDILDVTKIERGLLSLSISDIAIRPTVESVMQMFEKDALAKGLRIEAEISSDLPDTILTDELRLRQILGNLLSNAIKFTDEGRIAIEIVRCLIPMHKSLHARHGMSLTVSDTGIGIPDHEIPKLLHPFVQLDSARSRGAGGSGLGLAIVHEIVRLMGGRFHMQSSPGAGTRVNVVIPFNDDMKTAAADRQLAAPMAAAGRLAGLRVLVAEDNAINVTLAREHLQSLGCTISTVPNGEQALIQCARESFDIVLMDCTMPVLDGLEATRRILSRHDENSPPVIIGCSTNGSERAIFECLAAGMYAVLVKPYTREDLVRVLSSLPLGAPQIQPAAPSGAGSWTAELPESTPAIDLSLLDSLKTQFKDSPGLTQRLLDLFQVDVSKSVAELGDAMARGDLKSSARIAHTVKGSAASMGAKRLAALCGMIEQEALKAADHRSLVAAAASCGLALASEYAAAAENLRAHLPPL
ncbi:MAG: ATP-binding protein [Luteolibacter sp.]